MDAQGRARIESSFECESNIGKALVQRVGSLVPELQHRISSSPIGSSPRFPTAHPTVACCPCRCHRPRSLAPNWASPDSSQ